MHRLFVLVLTLLLLPGCTLCWPRGGPMGRCSDPGDDDDTSADDDDTSDDDDVGDDDDSGDDDDATGDDDDATPPCTHGEIVPVTVGSATWETVCVHGGSFMMGSEKSGTDEDERPVHEVILTRDVLLGRTEITQGLWEAVAPGTDPSNCEAQRCVGDDRPVQNLNWNQAIDFANALSVAEGLTPAYEWIGNDWPEWDETADGWRLPTESEWEYAARAGEAFRYSGSDDWEDVGYCDEWSDDGPLPVGFRAPNAWGFLDMSGNVQEWVWDTRDDYPVGPATDPTGGAPTESFRIARGGFFYGPPATCRVAQRGYDFPTSRDFGRGIRLARTINR